MLLGNETKKVASTLRKRADVIFNEVFLAFEDSIVGCNREVEFFRKLLKELSQRLGNLRIPDVKFSCRHAEIHQKPIVTTSSGGCELGDLLIVIKYHLLDFTTEAKSIIYQVKLADGSTTTCKIDQKQLHLLKDWPPFEFGRKKDGGKQQYIIRPQTLEFGSYMLEPRNVQQGRTLSPWGVDIPLGMGPGSTEWRRTYGLCPTAWQCHLEGPKTVDLQKLHHIMPDADSLLSLIFFETGEHHSNSSVQQLINALYRYVGLDPDPPYEFEGFPEGSEEDGFAILEINVTQTGEG